MPALTSVKGTAKTKQLSFNPIKGSTLNSSQPSQAAQQSAAFWHKIAASTGSQTTFTTSFWIKRTGGLGVSSEIWNAYDGTNYFELFFDSDDKLKFSWNQASTARYQTARTFKDLNAWNHIILSIDTTQATTANRRRLYLNGVDISSELSLVSGSEIVQNATAPINKVGVPMRIGTWSGGGNYTAFANFSEFYHIDGRQLTQYDFGAFNGITGQWEPRKFSGNTQWTRYIPTAGMLSQTGLQSFNASLVFDNDITTTAFFTDSSAAGSFLQWDLGAGNTQAFRRIRFQFSSPTVGLQATWNVQYSDDASSWTSVQTSIVSHPDYSLTKRSYNYELYASWGNVGAHRYWRIYKINAAAGGDYCSGVDFYTLSGTDYYGSCGFYLPFDRLFDKNVTNVQLPDLGDSYFAWSGRSGYASATDDRSQTVSVLGTPTVNTSGGPKTNNGYYMSGFAQPTVNATSTGAVGLQTADSTVFSSLPSTGQTWACWMKSSSTKNRGGAWRVGVTCFGDYRNSVYAGFGLNNGRVAFGMNSVWEGTTTLSDGAWHHIALVYDGGGTGTSGAGTWMLYADGKVERAFRSSQETSQPAWDAARMDCIGFTYAGYGEVSPTAMTGICVYKRALSDTEILGLYNGWDPINALDRSGNANNFYSVGTRTDLKDSPSNFYNQDTGVGGEVSGNYPIINPYTSFDGAMTFGGLTTTTNDVIASFGVSSGKWYWEYQMPISDDSYGVGASGASGNVQHFGVSAGMFNSAANSGIYSNTYGQGRLNIRSDQQDQKTNGSVLYNVATVGSFNHYFPGDYVGFALNLDVSPITLTYYRNGVSNGQHTATYNGRSPIVPFFRTNGYTGTANFGQWPFRYAAPSGYKTINTQNLPKPITPSQHFEVVTWTGDGGTKTVTGLSFKPDLVWIKAVTGSSFNHVVCDNVRGTNKTLFPNNNLAQYTDRGITAFNSDGFTTTASGDFNPSGQTVVAWCWKAGGTPVSNLIKNSEILNVSGLWSAGSSGVTTTLNNATDPQGTTTATFIKEDSSTGRHRIGQNYAFVNGTTYTASVYAKSTNRHLNINCASAFGALAGFDLINGVVGTVSQGSATITNAGNGWWRCSVTGACTSSHIDQFLIQVQQTTNNADVSYNGDNASGIYAWGAQLEATSTPSQYVSSGLILANISANKAAGFSIVTYTGNGLTDNSANTIGHGHGGQNPSIVLIKRIDSAASWAFEIPFLGYYNASYGPNSGYNGDSSFDNYVLHTDTTGGVDGSVYFQTNSNANANSPNTATFQVGYDASTNANGATYVAYVWSEIPGYSKMGHYLMNGAANGPFIYTGFRPRWILVRSTSANRDWLIWDTARNGYINPLGGGAQAIITGAAYGSVYISDIIILSNGFKFVGNGSPNYNATDTLPYIYMAFADVAGKYTRGR
jgi:Concanavalin A-like lectin/glucanases superfamily